VTNGFKKQLFLATALAAIGLTTGTAFAQDASAPSATTPAPADQATAQETAAPAEKAVTPKKAETVVVTGSRIRRDTFTTGAALTVLTRDEIRESGEIDLTETLQTSVAAAGSSQINNFYTGFVVEGGPGAQTVGLNSLGAGRTLILMNGRRFPISGVGGTTGFVDLQSIPSLAVARTEILKDGASPLYGSDAVGGVINMITRQNVNGFELSFDGSSPFEGGAEEFRAGALWGKTADNWNVMVSAEYFEQKPLTIGDRGGCNQDYVFDADTGKRADFIDPKTGEPRCYGRSGTQYAWLSTPYGNFVVDPAAPKDEPVIGVRPDIRPFRAGDPGFGTPGTAGRCIRSDGANVSCSTVAVLTAPGFRRLFNPKFGELGDPIYNQFEYNLPAVDKTQLISPSKSTNIYAQAARDLDILGGVEIFGELLMTRRESSQEYAAQLFASIPGTAATNPFRDLEADVTFVALREIQSAQKVDTGQLVLGVRGQTGGFLSFLKRGTWEVSGQTSTSNGDYSGTVVYGDRVLASAETTLVNGVLTCPKPKSASACLPINLFDPRILRGEYTDAEKAYLFTSDPGKTEYKQTVFDAVLTGDLFEIKGAGDPVAVALGLHGRDFSINDVPGAEARSGNTPFDSSAAITKGSDSVIEAFGELSVPLLAKQPMIESLELKGAYRYTNYDSYPENSTWKLEANWALTPQFRLVASSGTSYRAPQLWELYLGNQTGFQDQSAIDPCINWGDRAPDVRTERCAAEGIAPDFTGGSESAMIISGGGKGTLKEEESRSDIFSFVFTPSFADLKIRLDSWQIKITDQIASFGGSAIVGACYSDTTGRAAEFCKLFKRDTDPNSDNYQGISTVQDNYVNINSQFVRGLDMTVDYAREFSFGRFAINSETRWSFENRVGLFDDLDPTNLTGRHGNPAVVSTNRFNFTRKDWRYTWEVRTIGSTSSEEEITQTDPNPRPVVPGTYYSFNGIKNIYYKARAEVTTYHTFSVRYRSDDWTIVGAIQNVFDETPPSVSTGTASRLGNPYLLFAASRSG
jgi:iron complex outermembrane recepter protein